MKKGIIEIRTIQNASNASLCVKDVLIILYVPYVSQGSSCSMDIALLLAKIQQHQIIYTLIRH